MRRCSNIEIKSSPNQWPGCFRVGIGRQHPAFVPTVAKNIHQGLKFEFDVGTLLNRRKGWGTDETSAVREMRGETGSSDGRFSGTKGPALECSDCPGGDCSEGVEGRLCPSVFPA